MLFKPMAIYYCSYSNFHHDPNPLVFILYSDSKYTHTINLHYLTPTRRYVFFSAMRKLAAVGSKQGMTFHYNGEMMYEIFKRYYPDMPKVAYRVFFSSMLLGTLVNDCLSASSPLMTLYLKTQSMMGQASTNLLETKAKNEPYSQEVNKYLKNTRVQSMNSYEDMKYTIKELPGPSAIPPDQVTPQQGADKIKPQPPG